MTLTAGRHVSFEPWRSLNKPQAPPPSVHSLRALLDESVLAALACTHLVVNDACISSEPPPEQLVALLTQLRAVRYLRAALWTHAHRHLTKSSSCASLWSGRAPEAVLSPEVYPSAGPSRGLDFGAAGLEERVARLEPGVDVRLLDAARVRVVRTAWVWTSVNGLGAAADELSHPFGPPNSPLDRLVARRAFTLCQSLQDTIRDAFQNSSTNGVNHAAAADSTAHTANGLKQHNKQPDNLLVQQLASWISEVYSSVSAVLKDSKTNLESSDAGSAPNGRRSQGPSGGRRSKSKALGSREVRRTIREMMSENEPHARTSLARAAATAQSSLSFEPDLDVSGCSSSIVGMLTLSRISQISNVARTPEHSPLIGVNGAARLAGLNGPSKSNTFGTLRSLDSLNEDTDGVAPTSRSLENLADRASASNGLTGPTACAATKTTRLKPTPPSTSAVTGTSTPTETDHCPIPSNKVILQPPSASTPQPQPPPAPVATLSASHIPAGSVVAVTATTSTPTSNGPIPNGARTTALTSTDAIGKLVSQQRPHAQNIELPPSSEAPQSFSRLPSGTENKMPGPQQIALVPNVASNVESHRTAAPNEKAAAKQHKSTEERKRIALELLDSETRYVNQLAAVLEVTSFVFKLSTLLHSLRICMLFMSIIHIITRTSTVLFSVHSDITSGSNCLQ